MRKLFIPSTLHRFSVHRPFSRPPPPLLPNSFSLSSLLTIPSLHFPPISFFDCNPLPPSSLALKFIVIHPHFSVSSSFLPLLFPRSSFLTPLFSPPSSLQVRSLLTHFSSYHFLLILAYVRPLFSFLVFFQYFVLIMIFFVEKFTIWNYVRFLMVFHTYLYNMYL